MTHTVPIQIRFRDTDQLGHVNNAVYLSYLEIARVDFVDRHLDANIEWDKLGFLLARVEIDFLKPILLNDRIEVEIWISRLGTKSFVFSYAIWNVKPAVPEKVATASSVIVCFDFTKNETMPILPAWREKLEPFFQVESA